MQQCLKVKSFFLLSIKQEYSLSIRPRTNNPSVSYLVLFHCALIVTHPLAELAATSTYKNSRTIPTAFAPSTITEMSMSLTPVKTFGARSQSSNTVELRLQVIPASAASSI